MLEQYSAEIQEIDCTLANHMSEENLKYVGRPMLHCINGIIGTDINRAQVCTKNR